MGDLFDAWLGDDQRLREPLARDVVQSMRAIGEAGVPLYLACGNRDFLLGHAFARDAGATLLGDQSVVDIAGTRTLVTHGDEFCTDDAAYQRFRAGRATSGSCSPCPTSSAAGSRTACAAVAARRPRASPSRSST